jgi:hypothetical protein
MHDSTAACCPTVASGQPQATIVKAGTIAAPALRVVATFIAHVQAPATPLRELPYDASPPGSSSQPPPYIAFSALLI